MKTLIFLFLFVSIGHAQTTTPLSPIDSTRKVLKEKYGYDLVLPIVQQPKTWQQELISLWKEYKSECYKDSTVNNVWLSYDSLATVKYYEQHPDIPKENRWGSIMKEEKIYSHKQPTFEGFMEWFGKRLGDK